MHPSDLESYARIVGSEEVPAYVEEEYQIRLKMYHADGNSGPLGAIGLIDLLRFLGVDYSGIPSGPPMPINWRKVPRNGTVRVAVQDPSGTAPPLYGKFFGFVQHGTLAVQLDGSDEQSEYRRDWVTIVDEKGSVK